MDYRRLSIVILTFVAIVCGYLGFRAIYINFNYDFEAFYPVNDPDADYFLKHREKYGNANDFVLIGVVNSNGIFKEKFLKNIKTLTDSLKKLTYVKQVKSPTNIFAYQRDPLLKTPIKRLYLHYQKPAYYKADSIRIYQDPALVNHFFAQNGQAINIYVQHQELLSQKGCHLLTQNIKRLLQGFSFEKYHLAGRCIGQSYYVQLLRHEVLLFVGSSFLLILVVLILTFRSVWGVLLPLLVVGASIIGTLGIMTDTNKAMDLILNAMPTILLVIGLSNVIHLLSKYLEELRKGASKMEAIKCAYYQVGLATFLTTITTGVGFMSLATGNVRAIVEFGIYCTVGLILSFVMAYTLLPAVLVLMKAPKATHNNRSNGFWKRTLSIWLAWVFRYPKIIVGISLLITLVSVVGLVQVEENSYMMEDLSSKSPIKQDFQFFEQEFSGVRPFEIALELKDSSKTLLDFEVLRSLEEIENFAQKNFGLGHIWSPLALVKNAQRALNGNTQVEYRLPKEKEEFDRVIKELTKHRKLGSIQSILHSNQKEGRMHSRMQDVGSKKFKVLQTRMDKFMQQHPSKQWLNYKITGSVVLVDKNNNNLFHSLWQSLLFAFTVIGLIIGFLYKSFKFVLISLITNILPLLVITGIMGYTGLSLKLSTTIVFTIAFGIAVDDTIHFLSKLRIELRQGKDMFHAIKTTYFSTGKAIVLTSLVLCGGFLTLAMSAFLGTFYLGLLVSITLLMAVVADLFLLPALLILTTKTNQKTKVLEEVLSKAE